MITISFGGLGNDAVDEQLVEPPQVGRRDVYAVDDGRVVGGGGGRGAELLDDTLGAQHLAVQAGPDRVGDLLGVVPAE
jgi:hypothetical protein